MLEIEWLPLRLNIIPLIDKQTRKVLSIFLKIKDQILEGDILAVPKLQQLKIQIQQRLKEIDRYYQKKGMDPRIKYLYASRALLMKMASSHHQFQKINEEERPQTENKLVLSTPKNQQMTTYSRIKKSTSPISSQRKDNTSTPIKKTLGKQPHVKYSNNPINSTISHTDKKEKKIAENKNQPKEKIKLSEWIKTEEKIKGQIIDKNNQSEYIFKKGSSRKLEQGLVNKNLYNKKSHEVHELQKQQKDRIQQLQKSPFQIKKSFKDLSELVFTIKMTKQEYNQFIKLKRKNNHA